jgi:hypothetical protein
MLCILLTATLSGCAATPATPSPATSTPTGITGQVVAGPQCPVQRVPPDSRCADRPTEATIQVVDTATGRTAATVRTTPDGRFRIELPPGRYQVQVLNPSSGMAAKPTPPVIVSGTGMTEVTFTVDTGIR